ncbi:MAG: hypothetical protein AAFR65_10480 [Pseudomonadota bacterium]
MEPVFLLTESERDAACRRMDEIVLAMNNGDTNWAMELADEGQSKLMALSELKTQD